MVAQHLELPLASIFADRAVLLEDFKLPDELHGSWLTARNIQLLHVQKVLKSFHNKYDMKEVCKQVSGFPKLRFMADDLVHNALLQLSKPWRVANGVFPYTKLREQQRGKILDETMLVGKEFTDDQWFFGVIFDVHKLSWTMTPCVDKMATPEEIEALDPIIPIYQLPKPQDVDATYRKELKAYGRVLPPFQVWVDQNRHYFPTSLKDDPAYTFTAIPKAGPSTRQQRRSETALIDRYDADGDYVPPPNAVTTLQQHQSRKRSSTASANSPTKRQQTIAERSLQDSALTQTPSIAARNQGHVGSVSTLLDQLARDDYPFSYTVPKQVSQQTTSQTPHQASVQLPKAQSELNQDPQQPNVTPQVDHVQSQSRSQVDTSTGQPKLQHEPRSASLAASSAASSITLPRTQLATSDPLSSGSHNTPNPPSVSPLSVQTYSASHASLATPTPLPKQMLSLPDAAVPPPAHFNALAQSVPQLHHENAASTQAQHQTQARPQHSSRLESQSQPHSRMQAKTVGKSHVQATAQAQNTTRHTWKNEATSADGAADIAHVQLNTMIATAGVYPKGFAKDFNVPGGYVARIQLKKL